MIKAITKVALLLVTCSLYMNLMTSCGGTNEDKRDAAIAKIEKSIESRKFDKALKQLGEIPSDFVAEIETYESKIKEAQIKNKFTNVWYRKGKEAALRNEISEMYPYVGSEYLLSELLKLEYFDYNEQGYSGYHKFNEYYEDVSQSSYESCLQSFNYCAEGWNKALQNIALLAAQNEDYATANRCMSEFKPIMAMVSRTYRSTSEYDTKYYDYKSKLIPSPLKKETLKKVQAVKMINEVEREFNAANFARGSAQLTEEAKVVLNKLVRLLAQDSALSVKFIGHTSADGDASFNQQLSKDRARAAANYLENKGINYIRISHEGKGSSELQNKVDPTAEENCRIEIILM